MSSYLADRRVLRHLESLSYSVLNLTFSACRTIHQSFTLLASLSSGLEHLGVGLCPLLSVLDSVRQ